MMSIWYGLDNGVPTADMNPAQLAPTQDDQLQWPLWGMYYLSGGSQGVAPDLPEATQLVELLDQWRSAASFDERGRRYGTRCCRIYHTAGLLDRR